MRRLIGAHLIADGEIVRTVLRDRGNWKKDFH